MKEDKKKKLRTDCRCQQRSEMLKEDIVLQRKSEKQKPEHSKWENTMGRSKFWS